MELGTPHPRPPHGRGHPAAALRAGGVGLLGISLASRAASVVLSDFDANEVEPSDAERLRGSDSIRRAAGVGPDRLH